MATLKQGAVLVAVMVAFLFFRQWDARLRSLEKRLVAFEEKIQMISARGALPVGAVPSGALGSEGASGAPGAPSAVVAWRAQEEKSCQEEYAQKLLTCTSYVCESFVNQSGGARLKHVRTIVGWEGDKCKATSVGRYKWTCLYTKASLQVIGDDIKAALDQKTLSDEAEVIRARECKKES